MGPAASVTYLAKDIWLIIMALEKNIARATNIKQFAAALQPKNQDLNGDSLWVLLLLFSARNT